MPEPAIPATMQPVDADVDPHIPTHHQELPRPALPVLAVISLGGMLGALGRYGLGVAFPHSAVEFPWATFVVNVTGCALIGVPARPRGSARARRPRCQPGRRERAPRHRPRRRPSPAGAAPVTAIVLVALGAALGAPARCLADWFIQARHDSVFPWGTLAVNVAGSFLLGL
ncbi:MAG: CrcB family protein, partial [Pseudonocardiaceae bacterium]